MANKLLGQHFLNDPSGTIAAEMITALAPARGETIVEIGPGRGALTRPLAEACKRSGAWLVTIEKDPQLAAALAEEFEHAPNGKSSATGRSAQGVQIITGDALTELKSPDKLIGNIPYYLTGHLLRLLSESRKKPARCVFMVQKEVAERLAAAPPRMNRLAASVQFWAEPKIILSVARTHFAPPPAVDSAVVVLERKRAPGNGATRHAQAAQKTSRTIASAHYYAAVRALFAQPRKTVRNNLAAGMPKTGAGEGKAANKETADHLLRSLGIDPEARPQDLSIPDIVGIACSVNWG